MPKFLFTLAAVSSPLLYGESINVADHGVFPEEDATRALNELIASVRGKQDVTLRFPKGRYLFRPENAIEVYRAVANHDNGLKRIAFPLFGFRNIMIDGDGSQFIFHGRMTPFEIDASQGVTLKDFSIDWARPFHDELEVVSRDEKDNSFVVKIDGERYPYTVQNGELFSDKDGWQDSMGANIVFDPKTRAPIHGTGSYSINFYQPYKATSTGKDLVKIEAKVKQEAPPVGSFLISYGVQTTNRLSPAIHAANTSDLKIEKVTVYQAGGMAVIAERCENVHLDHVTVTSTEDRLVSTRADATHFLGCKGTVRVENCLFEHMLDDGINVHGAYVKVVEYLGENDFLCEISHFQQWGLVFGDPGDKVSLLSRETVLPFFETSITKSKVLNEHRFIVTLADVPESLPEGPLSMENLTWNPDLIFRKNIIRENRARSILVTTKGKVLIEDNYLSSQMHGILIEGDNNVWYESGGVGDVMIRNNTFVNSGYEGDDKYPLYATPLLNAGQRMGEGYYHRNIHFVDNTLKSFNGHMVYARSIDGLTITGNKLDFSSDYPEIKKYPSINLGYCDNVTITGNQSKGFDHDLEFRLSNDTQRVTVEKFTAIGKN